MADLEALGARTHYQARALSLEREIKVFYTNCHIGSGLKQDRTPTTRTKPQNQLTSSKCHLN